MSSKDDGSSAVAMVFGVIAMALMAVAIFVAAVVGFICFVLTILCLIAWNDGLELGDITITSDEARTFILRGIAFAVLIPAFWLLCCGLFQIQMPGQYWPYFFLGGYVFGSIGIPFLEAQEAANNPPPPQVLPPVPNHRAQGFQQYTPPPEANPAPQRPFNFASWDDEDAA